MQNEQDLKQIGFRPTPNQELYKGEFFFRGKNQIFTAKVNYDYPAYVTLYIAGSVDRRPRSAYKGYRFRKYVKDCCSTGSVEKAIKEFDVPTDKLKFIVGGCMVIA